MRVISGSARGCKLKAPDGLETRPTTDRIKESLFNILSPFLIDCRFLDLFSGSGAIGIEALSRGAKRTVFCDCSDKALKITKENIEKTRLNERSRVINSDALKAIDILAAQGEKFDIIFLDPPYKSGLYKTVLEKIAAGGILAKDGFIISEHSSEDNVPDVSGLECFRVKDYKTTKMLFWAGEKKQ